MTSRSATYSKEALYEEIKSAVEYFEEKFISKDGTMLRYRRANEYFKDRLTVMNARHLLVLCEAVNQFFKVRRPRKARIYMLIIDSIAAIPSKIIFDIFGNVKFSSQIDIIALIEYTRDFAKKYHNERAFVGHSVHLISSIGVASCNEDIWRFCVKQLVSMLCSRQDASVKGFEALNAECRRINSTLNAKRQRYDEMQGYKEKGDFASLEDESDRALDEFVLEFKNLRDVEIPKLEQEFMRVEEQSYQMLLLLQAYSSGLLQLFQGKTSQGILVPGSSRFFIDGNTSVFDNLVLVIKNLIEFFTSPPTVSSSGKPRGKNGNFRANKSEVFDMVAANALETLNILVNNDQEKTCGWKNSQEQVLNLLDAYLSKNTLATNTTNSPSKQRSKTHSRCAYTFQTLRICKYAYRVESVCKGEVKASHVYMHESRVRLRLAKKRDQKVFTLKEIYDAQVLSDDNEDILYFHLVKENILWENPYHRNNYQKNHNQNYENFEIVNWSFEKYMKLYQNTERENENLYVRITLKDLLFFLNNQVYGKVSLAESRRNIKRVDAIIADRKRYISYTNACLVLSRGIRRYQAYKFVAKLREKLRNDKGKFYFSQQLINFASMKVDPNKSVINSF